MNDAYYNYAKDILDNMKPFDLLRDLRENGIAADIKVTEETLKAGDRIEVVFGDTHMFGTMVQWLNANDIQMLTDAGNVFTTQYVAITTINGVLVIDPSH